MEESKKKKALIMTLGVLAGIIAITVAVTFLLGRGRGGAQFSGPEDVPYPYSWTEKDNGTIVLSLSVGGEANAAWNVMGEDGSQVKTSVEGTKGGNTSVTLTPVAEGRETVTLSLLNGGERLAEAVFAVESVQTAEGKLVATIASHRERAFQSVVRGGEETGHPFTVSGGDEGLTIYVEDTEGYTDSGTAWNSQSLDAMVASVSTIDVGDEGVTIQLETRANGSAEVTVYNETRDISYVFSIEVSKGEMILRDFQVGTYLTEQEPEPEESESVEESYEAEPRETETAEPTEAETPEPTETEATQRSV